MKLRSRSSLPWMVKVDDAEFVVEMEYLGTAGKVVARNAHEPSETLIVSEGELAGQDLVRGFSVGSDPLGRRIADALVENGLAERRD